ncbi:type i restriction-modification system, m subunit [Ligilactobacillus acidipiscis DSM 15836]|uniref:site-specific DNA-methyltransferase (adenine-specific) n=1 Tax=Ligilactobacillus acidipiscis DSM 15836 TaxID=1423716 RepID=A0ABR5PKM4_9LACO|nr:type I restriction-modification system subunit M [Ligilactobacillus acidipiscis]KRM28210.1 type i restriction-modification system, m subunit [Ligilactobacillus acidipiscis DSM 15836]GAW64973.1 type I restriction-modification system DNA-methyltransferase subunit M [Ligilactobacillus acidipiscis]GEN20892.1 type I restriction-modification system subunit M [Ligilactobacillus acidipiscis]
MITTSEEIKRRLWDGANDLRGSMDASRYKDYMLGLMFYKFLSDQTLATFRSTAGVSKSANNVQEYEEAYQQLGDTLSGMIQKVLGYYVLPEHLYQTWVKDIRNGDFELQKVMDSLNSFERNIEIKGDADDFKGLFSTSIIDLTDSALGNDLNKRSKNIKDLILLFADLDMVDLQNGDVLGDAYEYLIGQFASSAGKKAGEFYTPRQVSEVLAQIVVKSSNISSVYDPTVGSGSLLLTVGKHLNKSAQRDLHYYGQEFITETYNLTRMNLLLHGVRPENMDIKNGNTLAEDWPEDPERPEEGVQFDAVVMNPPYSDSKWNKHEDKPLKVSDPRFADFGVLPPDSKGDFAYLMHGLYHLGQKGTMAIVLPHGVLFRGGTEGQIRKRLLEKNYVDAVIGLPSNMFTNTGIPVCVMILKKNRELSDPVLLVDSSEHFVKIGKQNVLREKDIAQIVDTYVDKIEVAGYSHLADRKEIIENEYNLNIPRYVEAMDSEIPQDVDGHLLGGIPMKNIADLKVLNSIVKDVLDNALTPLREGYVELNESVDDLTKEVLADERVKNKSAEVEGKVTEYLQKFWGKLISVDSETELEDLRDEMLAEIKQILSKFDYLDAYAGYQIIAEIWKNTLFNDTELIAGMGFYTAGRTREPNMVTKGTGQKKHEEQDGWIGAIVPNDLIAKNLYSELVQKIADSKEQLTATESELSELVEAAKVEDSDENSILYDSIKKNKDDEPQDSFDNKKIKAELKEAKKGSDEYQLLHKVSTLMNQKSKLNTEIKNQEKELQGAVYERIENLTNEEVNSLVYEKWFGGIETKIVNLVQAPLKNKLQTLETLNTRYSTTLSDLEKETEQVESEFESLLSELVVK